MNKNYIFTFWEPEHRLPAYLRLCMKTWEKFLPEYEIINCNYNNLEEFLPKKIINQIVEKKLSLAKQADCIRAWLLHVHGGFWFDADTILCDNKIVEDMQNHKCCMFGDNATRRAHIGVIYAKQDSQIIKAWANEIPNRIINIREYSLLKLYNKLFRKEEYKLKKHWGYFGNNIIDPMSENSTDDEFYIYDKYNLNVLLEYKLGLPGDIHPEKLYCDFYFDNVIDYKESLNENKGIILLHNSWTPEVYKNMNEKEFLQSGTNLANILKEILSK